MVKKFVFIEHPTSYKEAKLAFYVCCILFVFSISAVINYEFFGVENKSLQNYSGEISWVTKRAGQAGHGAHITFKIDKKRFRYTPYTPWLYRNLNEATQISVLAEKGEERVYEIINGENTLVSINESIEREFSYRVSAWLIFAFSLLVLLYFRAWVNKFKMQDN